MPKGELPQKPFHEYGIELAKKNLAILKSSKEKNIDSIKKEVALSLEELENMPKNSIEEMNEFVKSYNLDL